MRKSDLVPPILYKTLGIKRTNKYVVDSEAFKSFSQYNEDLIIDIALENKANGFYVDVGANHPTLLNNTKRFYDKGWRGINIEPNATLFKNFQKERERDINLNIGIGPKKGTFPFYVMEADTLSSFSKKDALASGKIHGSKLKEVINIEVCSLAEIFNQHVKDDTVIDFLSVDVEGLDYQVLISNDWNKFKPNLVMVESGEAMDQITSFLTSKNYVKIYDNSTNAIYKLRNK